MKHHLNLYLCVHCSGHKIRFLMSFYPGFQLQSWLLASLVELI